MVSFGIFFYLYYPLGRALFFYETKRPPVESDYKTTDRIVDDERPKDQIDYNDFYLEVPDIFAVSRVAANVSAVDKNEYLPILADNIVAHAKGSDFPGEGTGKTIYLFAHSTHQDYSLVRKNAVFYLLSKLEIGNEIIIDFNGKKYLYRVYDSRVVGSKEVTYLEYKVEGEESLLLQTCWPLGTNWNRLIVFARLVTII